MRARALRRTGECVADFARDRPPSPRASFGISQLSGSCQLKRQKVDRFRVPKDGVIRVPFVTSDTRHGRLVGEARATGRLRSPTTATMSSSRCSSGPDRPRQLPSNVQELETTDLRRGARLLTGGTRREPAPARRGRQTPSPRPARLRRSRGAPATPARNVRPGRMQGGDHRVGSRRRRRRAKAARALRLREWVKTPYPRWLEQPALVDNEDIALFYRASMREIREQRPTNAHVTDFVEVVRLADLAVMMGGVGDGHVRRGDERSRLSRPRPRAVRGARGAARRRCPD